jgi:hypothetical protein
MPAEANAPDPPSRSANLLGLVRKLIDYGRELAATIRQRAFTDPGPVITCFGTADVALILARIARGLHRRARSEAHPQRRPPGRGTPRRLSRKTPRTPPSHRALRGRNQHPPHPPAHAGTDRRQGPPPADRRRLRRHLPRPRHPAQPPALAGTADRHHQRGRQPRQPGEGHPGSGVSDHTPTASRIAGTAALAIPSPCPHRPALNFSQ